MKLMLLSGTTLFILGVSLALIQLWLAPWSAELFLKLEITIGALLLIAITIWFIRKEYVDHKRQATAKLDD
ncbi:MAG TPA: hypothetical protein VFM48_12620 [Aquabacterium sp.]|nr:hypothetical protein [Aquabacterium sp.]